MSALGQKWTSWRVHLMLIYSKALCRFGGLSKHYHDFVSQKQEDSVT
jgi:hypothetical protein